MSILWEAGLSDWAWKFSTQGKGHAAGVLGGCQKMAVQRMRENNICVAGISVTAPALFAASDPLGTGSPI
jgi:hypothetical protein